MYIKMHPRSELPMRCGLSLNIDIVDEQGDQVAGFEWACRQLSSDVQTASGSGATAMEVLRQIESGEESSVDLDGNGYVAHISLGRVWFSTVFDDESGGEITFAQYKFAVTNFVKYLADPSETPVTLSFPSV